MLEIQPIGLGATIAFSGLKSNPFSLCEPVRKNIKISSFLIRYQILLPGDDSTGALGSAGMPMPLTGVQLEPKNCCNMDSLHAIHSRSAVPNPDRDIMISRAINP
jgi:hypothetical protein